MNMADAIDHYLGQPTKKPQIYSGAFFMLK